MENQEKSTQLGRLPGINRFGEERPRPAGLDLENERGMHNWSEDNRSEGFQGDDHSKFAGPDFRESSGSRGAGGYRRSDEQIHESVLIALEHSADVETDEMEISVREGTVYLAGYVPAKEAIFFAESVVKDLPGVRGIKNDLKVKN